MRKNGLQIQILRIFLPQTEYPVCHLRFACGHKYQAKHYRLNIYSIIKDIKVGEFLMYQLLVTCIIKYNVVGTFWVSFRPPASNLTICHQLEFYNFSNMSNIKKIRFFVNNKHRYGLIMINTDKNNLLNDCKMDFEQFWPFYEFFKFHKCLVYGN